MADKKALAEARKIYLKHVAADNCLNTAALLRRLTTAAKKDIGGMPADDFNEVVDTILAELAVQKKGQISHMKITEAVAP
jgi:hypothetical protein